jgi:DNA-binding SARP family transcriptional activator
MGTNPPVWRLRVRLLGAFALEVNGKEVPASSWKSKKALNLFRYLASRRGEKVPRDVLNELLWPDTELDAATEQNLHTCVYFVRRIIDPDLERYGKSELVTCSGGLYCFEDTDQCWVDIEEFERLYNEGKKLQKIASLEAIEAFKQELALYQGDFLMEEPYLDWATELREYYREIYVDGALRVAKLLVDADDTPEAIQVCRNALRRDPYREDLHHAVIGYLLSAGRYSEAATQYSTYARMMREEFGLEPSREAQALYQQIQQSGKTEPLPTQRATNKAAGAYVCDRKFFESICRLEYRRQERSREPVTFMMVSIYDGKEVGQRQLYSIANMLRRGDAICQWDAEKVGICLWGTDDIGAKIVSHRLKRELEKDGSARTSISYDVIKAGDTRPVLEILQKAY